MTRLDFLYAVERAHFNPVMVRFHKDLNYGLERQTYSLWLVGEHSNDETLVMGTDTRFLARFHSEAKAKLTAAKLNKLLKLFKG